MGTKDEKKKAIGEYLKAADRFIQAAEYSQAMTEVKRALALEPGNMYALAYNQRIKSALDAQKKDASAPSSAPKKEAPPADAAAAPVPAVMTADPDTQKEAAARAEDQYTIKQQLAQIERFKQEIEALRMKHQQEIAVLAEELRQERDKHKEARDKYRVVVDDAEESYRRTEELYAEVVRLTEQNHAFQQEQQALLKQQEEHGTQLREAEDRYRVQLDQQKQAQAEEHALQLGHAQQELQKHEHEMQQRQHELVLQLGAQLEAEKQEIQRLQEEHQAEVARLEERLSEELQKPAPVPVDGPTRESVLGAVVSHLLLADTLSAEANDVMELVRTRLGFGDDEFVQLQTSVKFDIYRRALEDAWAAGFITPDGSEHLADLRKKIGVSAEDHFELEAGLRKAKKNR